jgi:hypothetical protein
MSSVARRVEIKLWLAHPSKLDLIFLPLTTIHLSAIAPNCRGVPKLRGVGASADSQEASFEEMTCLTRPPMSELEGVLGFGAGDCGVFETIDTIESSRFGYLS